MLSLLKESIEMNVKPQNGFLLRFSLQCVFHKQIEGYEDVASPCSSQLS